MADKNAIVLRDLEPPPTDRQWRSAPEAVRLQFYRFAADRAVSLKRAELRKGVGVDGQQLMPVKPRRDGATGKPLDPHYGESRSVKWLRASIGLKAGTVTLWWSHGFGVILGYHARGEVLHTYLRNVIGLTRSDLAKLKADCSRYWRRLKNGGGEGPKQPRKPGPKPRTPALPKREREVAARHPDVAPYLAKPPRERPDLRRKPAPRPKPKPAPAPAVPHTDPKLPQHVGHLEYIRKEHAAALGRIAAELGTTPEALRAEITAGFRGAVDAGAFYTRVDSGTLPKVLEAGRFKTQFEVNTSLGSYDPEGRSKAEAELFGTPPGTDPANRPVYGYVSRPGFASTGRAPEARVETYGDAVVLLGPHVRARATVTASDSLSFHDTLSGAPAADPTADALPVSGLRFGPVYERFLKGKADPGEWLDVLGERFGYLEAQYHGGLSAGDIAEVALVGPPGPKLRAQLEERGIPWRVIPRDAD